MNTELIEKLKGNWTAWGGLSEEERECITDNWEHTDWCNGAGWTRSNCSCAILNIGMRDIFRISPDFEVASNSSCGFEEYPIHIKGNHYFCEIEHTEATLYLLSELPSIVGFAGVQFKGGHPDEWSMSISQTVSGYSSTNDPKQKPATPIKARFYVEDSNA